VSFYPFMNTESEQEPFSVAKFAVGAIALAAVTLISFIGVTMLWPQSPSPAAPARGATTPPRDIALVVASPATAGRSADGGSMSRERQPAEPAAAPDSFLVGRADDLPDRGPSAALVRGPSNVPTPPAPESPAKKTPAPVTAMQPGAPRSATALSGRLLEILRAEDPENAPPQRPARAPPRPSGAERNPLNQSDATSIQRRLHEQRDSFNRSDATSIQSRLHELGYYFGDEKGVWGVASRSSLRDFKRMNGLQDDDKWDQETKERLLSGPGVHAYRTFIGRWALNANECLQRDEGVQLVISSRGAETASGKCDFRSFKQESENSWRIQAVCSASGRSWSADIGLRLAGPKLHWSSEKGAETYLRCLKTYDCQPGKPCLAAGSMISTERALDERRGSCPRFAGGIQLPSWSWPSWLCRPSGST
jgi:Putative peptidoglycan binding domain